MKIPNHATDLLTHFTRKFLRGQPINLNPSVSNSIFIKGKPTPSLGNFVNKKKVGKKKKKKKN